MTAESKPRGRGTSNRNERGSAEDRRRRREWLVETYRADVDVIVVRYLEAPGRSSLGDPEIWIPKTGEHDYVLDVLADDASFEVLQPRARACRCYRCGKLLTVDTVTVDRIIPGCKGGTYRRDNIRPACADCNSETGGALSRGREHQAAKKAARRRTVAR